MFSFFLAGIILFVLAFKRRSNDGEKSKPLLIGGIPALMILVAGMSIIVFPFQAICSDTEAELVLREGTRLTVKTSTINITIIAGKGFERKYAWGGCSLDAEMEQRGLRWFGSLGIYDPALSFGILSSLFPEKYSCNGISRTVVQEGQIHFENTADAEYWIYRHKNISPIAWTNDGLLLQWDIVPERKQINADLWQICIDGKKPDKLNGATDKAFEVLPSKGSVTGRYECAKVGKEVVKSTWKQLTDYWAPCCCNGQKCIQQ